MSYRSLWWGDCNRSMCVHPTKTSISSLSFHTYISSNFSIVNPAGAIKIHSSNLQSVVSTFLHLGIASISDSHISHLKNEIICRLISNPTFGASYRRNPIISKILFQASKHGESSCVWLSFLKVILPPIEDLACVILGNGSDELPRMNAKCNHRYGGKCVYIFPICLHYKVLLVWCYWIYEFEGVFPISSVYIEALRFHIASSYISLIFFFLWCSIAICVPSSPPQ